MEDEKSGSIENLQSFDLGEAGGGEQLIIDYRPVSPGEYYVMTLGNAPKINNENKDDNDIKMRFFKLTFQKENRYSVVEFVTAEAISKIASLFSSKQLFS